MAKEAVGLSKIKNMIRHRSAGKTIADTAYRLGLLPWHVSYLTRFIKVCVSAEELMWLEEEASKHRFGTVGELLMDVFNRCYEKYYAKELKRGKKAA